MRRWRMVLAGAALTVPALVAVTPAQAANNNSACRQVTNLIRQEVHEVMNLNQELNRFRNEFCRSLDK